MLISICNYQSDLASAWGANGQVSRIFPSRVDHSLGPLDVGTGSISTAQ